ncbi:heterokaryon incompatibility protein-domain-containing protein [Paraphoma chrysanthemicola]|nr:heterokaryon incompatibility protein-domain-containing protein [Paraphoma chrysanthemicola]
MRHDTVDSTYTCLSYVWGADTTENLRTILVNGREFFVRPNLWDFLDIASRRSARDRNIGTKKDDRTGFDLASASQCLWIDALCIDQDNTRERNHQVQQMGTIYATAERVIAWFGKDDSLRRGFDIVNDPAEWMPNGPFSWHFLTLLSLHVYWQRAWITQETTLARRLFFLAHDEAVNFGTIVELGGLATQTQDWRLVQYKPLYDIHRRSESRTLVENVLHYHDKMCLDSRDKIFSLLSISSDRDQFNVDYNISGFELAKAMCARLNHICMCDTGALRSIFKSQGYNYYNGLTDREARQPCFILRLTPLKRTHGRCDICLNIFAVSYFVMEYDLSTAHVYCLQCSREWRSPEFHLVIARELNVDQSSPWHTLMLFSGGWVENLDGEVTLKHIDNQGNATFHASLSFLLKKDPPGLRYHGRLAPQDYVYPEWQMILP